MFDKKVKLSDIKVKSFVTVLDRQQQTTAKAGVIKGRKELLDTFTWNITVVDVQDGVVTNAIKAQF